MLAKIRKPYSIVHRKWDDLSTIIVKLFCILAFTLITVIIHVTLGTKSLSWNYTMSNMYRISYNTTKNHFFSTSKHQLITLRTGLYSGYVILINFLNLRITLESTIVSIMHTRVNTCASNFSV